MWHEGTILAPTKEGKTVVHYWAKVYDEGSQCGDCPCDPDVRVQVNRTVGGR